MPDDTTGHPGIDGRHKGRAEDCPAPDCASDRFPLETEDAVEGHEGSAPHWVAEHAVQVAEVGVNVCRKPRGECFCGLPHVAEPDLFASEPEEGL